MTARWRLRSRSIVLLLVSIFALLEPRAAGAQQAAAPADAPTTAPPEAAGMSAARLTRLTNAFKKEIEDKKVPGGVMLVARKGKLVYANALGVRDPRGAGPMRPDAIFRIYSMTEPMVSVAATILVEDGALQLTDPVSRWLPAFKDALTQAGLFKPGVIEFDIRDITGAEQVERLARTPLLYQPGTTWEYSLATDVLGRVVEAS